MNKINETPIQKLRNISDVPRNIKACLEKWQTAPAADEKRGQGLRQR